VVWQQNGNGRLRATLADALRAWGAENTIVLQIKPFAGRDRVNAPRGQPVATDFAYFRGLWAPAICP